LSKTFQQTAIGNRDGNLELDPAFCWQAVYSRDRRFDGRFFAGTTTTGVYCRSICPVSFGAPNNVRWFYSAAAAEIAGFRPCKRCRPDTSPGSSAWFGTWAVVSHAVKLISQGALNEGNLEQLADRVGIGSRHLRRLFQRHLGASPLKIARSHRVQVAGNLIAETDLSAREIARCTGFASIRQFNHSVKTTFGQSPTELRRLHRISAPSARQSGVVVYLPYRVPFDWSCLIGFLGPRATPGVEAVGDGFYRRTIEIDGVVGAIEVWDKPSDARLAMRVRLPKFDCLMQVVQRACRLFDLGADALHIGRHLGQDRKLASMVAERPGLRVPGTWDGFELAVRAVLGQQLTIIDSPTLVERMVETYGRSVEVQLPGLSHLFPQPKALAEANLSDLGIPSQRAETITSLARAVLARKLTFNGYQGTEGILAALRVLPYMDEGTMTYFAMRSLGEPDALPYTDLGLCRALGMIRGAVSPADLLRVFERFRPWRAYAAMHLWATNQKARGSIRTRATRSSKGPAVALPPGSRIFRVRNTQN
jgi:AraC family transcriptional regulator, regulatory protein of adaptative response / DNA-3-methyladenine glycosylase II